MRQNILLSPETRSAIDKEVEKLLKDLGNPKPPLDLALVRQFRKLELGHYSAKDTTWIQEKIATMKVAGKEIITDPTELVAVVKELKLKGVLLFDRRRILLDGDEPIPKLRWNQAHELAHDILPWHDGIAHGDPDSTLSMECHDQIEAEANYCAGRLLFIGEAFDLAVRNSNLCFNLVKTLHGKFGNTMTTTFWRIIERTDRKAFGLVSVHPKARCGDLGKDVRYFVSSPNFRLEYSKIPLELLFDAVCTASRGTRGPIGSGVLLVPNDRGESHPFNFECFYNGHDALTLVVGP